MSIHHVGEQKQLSCCVDQCDGEIEVRIAATAAQPQIEHDGREHNRRQQHARVDQNVAHERKQIPDDGNHQRQVKAGLAHVRIRFENGQKTDLCENVDERVML